MPWCEPGLFGVGKGVGFDDVGGTSIVTVVSPPSGMPGVGVAVVGGTSTVMVVSWPEGGPGGEGEAVAGGGGSDKSDEGGGTDSEGTDGSGVGTWVPGGGSVTGGSVSVTKIVVPGIVTVVPGIVTVIPGTVTVVPGMVTVWVTVLIVSLPPSGGTDTVAGPGLDGTAVVGGGSSDEGKVDVSVMVTGGSVMVTGGGQLADEEASWAEASLPWFLWCSARWKRPKAWTWEDARMTASVRSEYVFV